MYKVHAKIEGPKVNMPLLHGEYPVPAVLLNNFSGAGVTMEMLGSYGVTFGYQLANDRTELVEISVTHIVDIPAGTSVNTLTQ